MLTRIFNLISRRNKSSAQSFPLFNLPVELITNELITSAGELSGLIVSHDTYKLFQPHIRLKGAATLIAAILSLDYSRVARIANADPEIIFTAIKITFNNETFSTTALQFAASEHNTRILKLFLFAIEDNAPEKKEKFLRQLIAQIDFIQLDSLWENYTSFKITFNLWLQRTISDEHFNEAAAKFGHAQVTILPRHFLAEMCHRYSYTDGWHPASSFDVVPAPQSLMTTDVTQHYVNNFTPSVFGVPLGITYSRSRHKTDDLTSCDINQINFFLLRGRNSEEAMHGGQLGGLGFMAISARAALAIPTTDVASPAWLIEHGIAALEHDLATLRALAATRSQEFTDLINHLTKSIPVDRPKAKSWGCAIM